MKNINHKAEPLILKIYSDFLRICEDDRCAAILLSVFEDLTKARLEILNSEQEILGLDREFLWITKSGLDIEREINSVFKSATIYRSLKYLTDKGFLGKRKKESKIQYLFNYDLVIDALGSSAQQNDPFEKEGQPVAEQINTNEIISSLALKLIQNNCLSKTQAYAIVGNLLTAYGFIPTQQAVVATIKKNQSEPISLPIGYLKGVAKREYQKHLASQEFQDAKKKSIESEASRRSNDREVCQHLYEINNEDIDKAYEERKTFTGNLKQTKVAGFVAMSDLFDEGE